MAPVCKPCASGRSRLEQVCTRVPTHVFLPANGEVYMQCTLKRLGNVRVNIHGTYDSPFRWTLALVIVNAGRHRLFLHFFCHALMKSFANYGGFQGPKTKQVRYTARCTQKKMLLYHQRCVSNGDRRAPAGGTLSGNAKKTSRNNLVFLRVASRSQKIMIIILTCNNNNATSATTMFRLLQSHVQTAR